MRDPAKPSDGLEPSTPVVPIVTRRWKPATLIAGLLTAAAVAGSVLFLARHTRQSVEQFLIANELAGGRALAQGYELWDRVIERFIDYPELRQYFYDGVEVPEDPTGRARVLAMTELIGYALQSTHWLYEGKDVALLRSVDPELDPGADWPQWIRSILTTSPALRSFVRENPHMYPYLSRTLSTRSSLPRPAETAPPERLLEEEVVNQTARSSDAAERMGGRRTATLAPFPNRFHNGASTNRP